MAHISRHSTERGRRALGCVCVGGLAELAVEWLVAATGRRTVSIATSGGQRAAQWSCASSIGLRPWTGRSWSQALCRDAEAGAKILPWGIRVGARLVKAVWRRGAMERELFTLGHEAGRAGDDGGGVSQQKSSGLDSLVEIRVGGPSRGHAPMRAGMLRHRGCSAGSQRACWSPGYVTRCVRRRMQRHFVLCAHEQPN